MSTERTLSPAMAQYVAAKKQHPDAMLFFRMGDFYELFWDDAKEASRFLGITLTARNKGDNPIPMAGVPVRSLDTYLKRLVDAGYKVAICEQMQDPSEVKGVVDREVVRVVTPGTLTEDSLLVDDRANYLAAVTGLGKGDVGIAWIELSTGAFHACDLPRERLVDELTRVDPAELLVPEGDDALDELLAAHQVRAPRTRRPAFDFGHDGAVQCLTKFFRTATLEGFGIDAERLGIGAAGALIQYLQETQKAALPHIVRLEPYRRGAHMLLDRATRASLELVETMRAGGEGTPLLRVVDGTRTPMGTRLLREWLLAPLTEVDPIRARQLAVEDLFDNVGRNERLRDALAGILDLQRLTTRISCARANARDLIGLANSLAQLPKVRAELDEPRSERLEQIVTELDVLDDVAAAVASAIVDEPPTTIREGGMIREGHSDELDELRELATNSRQWLAAFQAREAERLGVANLKVGFNKVFGYYIEITHGNKGIEIPPEYVRKQTTKNAERYITDELKTFETKVLKAEESSKTLEYDLFVALRDSIAEQTHRLQRTAELVAELDCYAGFAAVARERNYHRPRVDDSKRLHIVDGRHPVIEVTHTTGTFVPNDTDLDAPDRRLVLLTGPNMAGKSTWIRQNALIVLLAQVGSFVPASDAHIGVVDRIFTRVGAADDISRGASTFMVEMTETANILNNASDRSLVVLDEVGRGTSTYDGLALAWSIAEDLHDRVACRALFATHYHQMTDLASAPGRGVVNLHVAVREWGDEIVFLHRIEQGGTDRSYGLHVGRLAGLPAEVLDRARSILDRLEEEGEGVNRVLREEPTTTLPRPERRQRQLDLFRAPRDRVLEELRDLAVDSTTPLEALQRVAEWQRKLNGHALSPDD